MGFSLSSHTTGLMLKKWGKPNHIFTGNRLIPHTSFKTSFTKRSEVLTGGKNNMLNSCGNGAAAKIRISVKAGSFPRSI